jgi:hypothetical protein
MKELSEELKEKQDNLGANWVSIARLLKYRQANLEDNTNTAWEAKLPRDKPDNSEDNINMAWEDKPLKEDSTNMDLMAKENMNMKVISLAKEDSTITDMREISEAKVSKDRIVLKNKQELRQ